MQQFPDISFSFLSTQVCTRCQLPVTCGPVYVVNDLSILCGRCRMTAHDHFRNYAYEALASTFLYPCKNWRNHCPAKLRWNDSLDHESDCNYKGCCTFFCSHPGAFLKGKRDLPDDETSLTLVPEMLLEHLECVLCRGYLSCSPIFIQSNGQNICHRCIYANGNPPNCRRNDAYEIYSQVFIFPCTYRNRGCKERSQFGKAIWKHEARCEFGPNIKRNTSPNQDSHNAPQRLYVPKNEPQQTSMERNEPKQAYVNSTDLAYSVSPFEQQPPSSRPKEKGIVKTHSGHIWATITPNKPLFAPPDDDNPDVNKQLLKSLAKKQGRQGRQIRRADEIGNEMGRRNSDSESISTNESYSMKTSRTSTPEGLDPSKRPYIPPEDYSRSAPPNSRPNSQESSYETGRLPQRYSDELAYNQGLRPNESFRISPGLVHSGHPGEYPVLVPHQLNDGLDSAKRVSHRDSGRGNTLLISELKLRQDIIKRTHSIKGERDMKSPYKQCNNLGDIMEVNRQLR